MTDNGGKIQLKEIIENTLLYQYFSESKHFRILKALMDNRYHSSYSIASKAGLDRKTVLRVLREWRRLGLIKSDFNGDREIYRL